jgi:hypothetical protein
MIVLQRKNVGLRIRLLGKNDDNGGRHTFPDERVLESLCVWLGLMRGGKRNAIAIAIKKYVRFVIRGEIGLTTTEISHSRVP